MPEVMVYHFTTWNLSDEHIGKVINVAWDASNYWQHKMTRGWVPQLANLPDNITVNGIPMSSLNELLNHMKYTSELLKEYIFDEIRSNEYPSKPSRRKCMFAFSTVHDPDGYAKRLGFDRTRYRLMTLRVLEGTKLHFGDMVHLNTNLSDHKGIVEAARRYWAGADANLPTAEAVIEGPLEIVRYC